MNLNKLSVLLLAALNSSFALAEVDAGSGNHLLNACNVFMSSSKQDVGYSEGLDAGYCVGMVSGVAETIILNDKPLACLPGSGITREQAVRIVVKYLNNHPEQLHHSASTLAVISFQQAFPCKS